MAEVSRRKFLTQVSVAVAVAGGALGLLSRVPIPGLPAGLVRRHQNSPIGDNVVAHLRDVETGEISVLAGSREIVYRDPELVDRLLTGAQQAAAQGR